jgi:hypothetical protein
MPVSGVLMTKTLGCITAAWALGACAGEGAPADATAGPDSGAPLAPAHERLDCNLPAAIEYCGGSTCHYDNAAPDLASGLTLWERQAGRMPDDVHTRLVGVPATYRNVQDPTLCPAEPELLIDPSDSERSLLLKKLAGTQQCGAEMPKFPYPEWGTVSNPGSQREALVQCIRDWVALLVEDYKRAP